MTDRVTYADGAFPEAGILLGVDYGTVRVGVAICDPDRRIAVPLTTIARDKPEREILLWRRLVAERRPVGLVVGNPVYASGYESGKSAEARRYAVWLHRSLGLPATMFDERYTSSEAESVLLAAGLTSKQRKAYIDQLAARNLLEAYLESGRRDLPPEPLDDDRRS